MSRTKGRARKAISRFARAAALPAEAREVDEHSWNASRNRLLVAYPYMPSNPIDEVLDLAFTQRSGCIEHSGELEDPRKIDLLVTTYIRYTLTDFQSLEVGFWENNKRHISKRLAVAAVSDTVEQIADSWRNGPSSNANAISSKIILEHDGEENMSSTTPRSGYGALPSSPISAALPPQFERPYMESIKIRLPTLEEVQTTARSRKPQLSSRHSRPVIRTVIKAHGTRSRLSKRKAPFYSGRDAEKLELAFARMDLTSMVQINTTDVDIDRSRFEAPPETRMTSLVAETAALSLQDTSIDHQHAPLLRMHLGQESSSDVTISDPGVNHYETWAARAGSRLKAPKPYKPRPNKLNDIRSAGTSLRDLMQNPRPKAGRIANASERLKSLERAANLRKTRGQEQAVLKATMRRIQSRSTKAETD